MQIAITKKLAQAIGIKPSPANNTTEPLLSWTANWTNTFERHKEDMVVMINNKNRFTVLIYGVKHNQFNDITAKMTTAIRNTLLAMNLNCEAVDEYLRLAGEIEFVSNHNRKLTSSVNRQGLEALFLVGRTVNESAGRLKFNDTLGHVVSKIPANCSSNSANGYIPAEEMIKDLTHLTGKPAYKYRAFELCVTLDLEIYKATRRLIVPADIEFTKLHKLLQRVFNWKSRHLHEFSVFDEKNQKIIARIVMSEDDFSCGDEEIIETGRRLSEYFPKYTQMLYTYDMGDNWEHIIELVRVIEAHDEESPYLLEAVGQSPPEDVGGIGGFIDFREIMLNPDHPDYAEMKNWARYWLPELHEWDTKPKVIYC